MIKENVCEMPHCGLKNIIIRVSTLSNVYKYIDMNQTEFRAVSYSSFLF